ncbi:MAG: hypothetical protein CVV44_13525 [Spirochaetae bacterium HGW-Spirochaetae-1]|jgi:predicted dehydrogenase|nr:MAG: hypothetical protein CVV44_13525 [Spirochaetae bacterium HGW-Spirochaetae-1]
MNHINVALIGCGRIGFLLENDPLRNKPCTHYGGCLSAGISITHAVDINEARLHHFASLAGLSSSTIFRSHTDLFRQAAPEMVIVATWTESHHEIGIAAAKNGARLIVMEKPIAPSLIKTRELLRACKDSGTILLVNHERRYDNRYKKVKSLIESGAIGEIRTVHASVLTGEYRGNSRIDEGGGPLLHDGTHLVDIIRFFFGEITCVSGEITRYTRKSGFEDRAAAWLKTDTGIDIFLEAGGKRNYFTFELVIWGSEGKIVIGNGYEKLYKNEKSGFYKGFRDLRERAFPRYKKTSCFSNLYEETKRLIKNTELPVTSSSLDGYKALEIIHAIYLSAHKNGQKINLPVSPSSIRLNKIFDLG